MNKEVNEMHTCSLELKGGLEAGIKYPAEYYHAPKSSYPQKNSHGGEAVDQNAMAMKMSMGR